LIRELNEKLSKENLQLVQFQIGTYTKQDIAPLHEGKPILLKQLEELAQQDKFDKKKLGKIKEDLSIFRIELDSLMRETRQIEKEIRKEIGSLEYKYGLPVVSGVVSDIRKFPENKKDFGYMLQFLADRTLSMVNAEWVFFRIIDTKNLNSLREYSETRGNSVLPQHKISNRALVSNEKLKGLTVVGSGHENFYIKTFCIIPKAELSSDHEVFIKAVVNQLEMLFLIFTSTYYRDSHSKNRNLSKL